MANSHAPDSSADGLIVCKAKDLNPDARAWIASMVGRELRDEDEVTVTVPNPSHHQLGDERAQARRRLLASMEQLSERFKDVPDDEMDAVLDEAMIDACLGLYPAPTA
ncbi:MAG: hypothetical protein KF708_11150 [Pirellulales bacterium]|nr:hypothetical protein [Pirellulales bacterium]